MNRELKLRSFSCGLLALCALVFAPPLSAQTKAQKPAETQDDVIRVNTELVQTDVMVFDKDGHFVDGLKADQFELKVNGKPTPVSFFERVMSGRPANSPNPAAATDAASTGAAAGSSARTNSTLTIVRGRTIIFFVDDLHLSPASVERTRKSL